MEKLGYAVNYRVVNASDYGVPQNRERLILVAFRNDLGKRFEFPPVQLNKENLTLRHILDIPEDVPNQVYWPYSPQAQSMVEKYLKVAHGRIYLMRTCRLGSREYEMI